MRTFQVLVLEDAKKCEDIPSTLMILKRHALNSLNELVAEVNMIPLCLGTPTDTSHLWLNQGIEKDDKEPFKEDILKTTLSHALIAMTP